MAGPSGGCPHCDSWVDGPYNQRLYRLDADRIVIHTICPNCGEVLRAWLDDESDFPTDMFTLEELEAISYHIQAARWHVAKSTRASSLSACDGCGMLQETFETLSDLEESVTESVQHKQQVLNE